MDPTPAWIKSATKAIRDGWSPETWLERASNQAIPEWVRRPSLKLKRLMREPGTSEYREHGTLSLNGNDSDYKAISADDAFA